MIRTIVVRLGGFLHDVAGRDRANSKAARKRGCASGPSWITRLTPSFCLMIIRRFSTSTARPAIGLGYSREELIGKHRSDFDVGLDDTSIQRLKQRLVAGEAITFETRHRRKDGTSFPVEVRVGQFEQGGRRFLCLVRDITERKRAEDELRASEARFRSFVDHATDGFFLFDEHQALLDVNRQACESLGYSREEMIGMHPRDFDAGLDQASIARIGERVESRGNGNLRNSSSAQGWNRISGRGSRSPVPARSTSVPPVAGARHHGTQARGGSVTRE